MSYFPIICLAVYVVGMACLMITQARINQLNHHMIKRTGKEIIQIYSHLEFILEKLKADRGLEK